MNNQNVLLLTGTDIKENSIGALYLNDLIKSAPKTVVINSYIEEPFMLRLKRYPRMSRLLNSAMARISYLQWARIWFFNKFILSRKVERIIYECDLMKIDFIWLTASTPELILIGNKLVDAGIHLKVTVWDAPEYLVENLRLPSKGREKIFRAFSNLLLLANNGMVPSWYMKKAYQIKYELDSVVIRHGLDDGYKVECTNKNQQNTSSVSLVFAGSLYSKDEWNALIAALESNNWRVGNISINVHYIGDFPLNGATRSSRVIYHGRKTFEETMSLLKTMDIGYVPYWFSKKFEVVAKTSFPGKVSSYAASGLAIFHHGPSYTEITNFLEKYPFGRSCSSLKAEDIIRAFAVIVLEIHSDSYELNRNRAFSEELSSTANSSKFNNFLGA